MLAESLVPAGIAAILIGFALVFIGALLQAKDGKTEAAVVGFIGPIPIGFGTSKNILYLAVSLSVLLLIIFLVLNKKLLGW